MNSKRIKKSAVWDPTRKLAVAFCFSRLECRPFRGFVVVV